MKKVKGKNYKATQKQVKKKKEKGINTNLSMITVNINGLNAPIQHYSVADWVKIIPIYMLHTKDSL